MSDGFLDVDESAYLYKGNFFIENKMKNYVMATIRIPLEIIDNNYEILNDRIDIQFDPCPVLPDIQENNKDLLQSLFSVNSSPNEEVVQKVFNLKKNPESIKKRQHMSFKKYRPRINHTQKKYE